MKLLTILARTDAITGEVIVFVNALDLDPALIGVALQVGENAQVVVPAGEDVNAKLGALWPDYTLCETPDARAVYTRQFLNDNGFDVGS